jgi:hypothetical protein
MSTDAGSLVEGNSGFRGLGLLDSTSRFVGIILITLLPG